MCVCLCRASQQCPSACTSEKQPCINRIPSDTIFSEGDAFQHMCWWMTTGWRCDFEAPNVWSLMTCACQCVSSLTLGGGEAVIWTDSSWARVNDLADVEWVRTRNTLNKYVHLSSSTCIRKPSCVFYVFKHKPSQQQPLCMRTWMSLLPFRVKELLRAQKSIYVTPGQDSEALNMPCLTFAWAQPAITATDKERKRAKERLVGFTYCRERKYFIEIHLSLYEIDVYKRDLSVLTW